MSSHRNQRQGSDPGPQEARRFWMLLLALTAAQGYWIAPVTAQEIPLAEAAGRKYALIKQADQEQYNLSLAVEPTGRRKIKSLAVAVAWQDAQNHYRAAFTRSTAELRLVRQGREEILAERKGRFLSAAKTQELVIKRRSSALAFLLNGQTALRVLDSTFAKGHLAIDVTDRPPKVTELKYQPIPELVFTDDFMRAEDETNQLGAWQPVQGRWRFYSVLEEIRKNPSARVRKGREPQAERSANPFSLAGVAEPSSEALIVAGQTFWDDLRFAASARTHRGKFGIVFGYRAPDEHFALTWDLPEYRESPGRLELVKVTPAGRHMLDAKYALGRADQWYRLEIRTFGDRVRAFVDETLVFDLCEPDCAGGQIGFYTATEAETFFDDVVVKPCPDLGLKDLIASAHTVQGAAKATDGSVEIADTEPCTYVFGDRGWRQVVLQTTFVPSPGAGEIGLVFGFADPGNYHRYSWAGGTQQLVQVAEGQAAVLEQAKCAFDTTRPVRLMLDLTESGFTKVYADGALQLMRAEPSPVGRVGFYAAGAAGSCFDDLQVAFEREADWERPVGREIFTEDPYMRGWASARWAWVGIEEDEPKKPITRFMHKGDFFGRFEIGVPVVDGPALFFGMEEAEPDQGYRLALAFDRDAEQCRLRLHRLGKLMADGKVKVTAVPAESEAEDGEAKPEPSYGKVTVYRDGPYVWAAVQGQLVLVFRDERPLAGRRVGLIAPEGLDLDDVEVRRDHVMDCMFERAPVNWLNVGRWEVMNRFACDPRWSHMIGESTHMAALWHKYEFQGDFTLEFYAGMRMRQGEMRAQARTSYPRIGDINTTLCADGSDLFSGYTFIPAEWDPLWSEKWTRLYRRERPVAETDVELIPRVREHAVRARVVPLAWDPGGRPIHGAWYYFKIRKVGDELQYYFDSSPVMTYRDPKPLEGGRWGIWTQENSIVVARAKISYEKRSSGAARIVPAPKPEEAPLDAPRPTVRLTSATHPGGWFEFEGDTAGWAPTRSEESARPEVDITTRASGRSSLKLTNIHSGGDFGVKVPVEEVDLSRLAHLSFDYQIGKGAKVNLYFSLKDDPQTRYFVKLTGGSHSDEDLKCVGTIKGAKDDGKWRHASVDLAAALRALHPQRGTFAMSEMKFGNFHSGYLSAGYGSNKAGAHFHLDDFRFVTAGLSDPTFKFEMSNSQPVKGYAHRLDQSKDTAVKGGALTEEGKLSLTGLKPGQWYLHVAAQVQDGTWTETTHYPFCVAERLALIKAEPPDGAKWGGADIQIRFGPKAGADLDIARCVLVVGASKVALKEHLARYDHQRKTLTLALSRAGLTFEDGQKIDFALHLHDNLAGKGQKPIVHQWHYVMSLKKDRTPPSLVELDTHFLDCSFEEDVGPFVPVKGAHGATLIRDRSTAASGKYSLKLYNRIVGGQFGVTAWSSAFSLGKYPLLCLDYRVPPHVRTDLVFKAGTAQRAVKVNDLETTLVQIGSVPENTIDDQWHHAELNLRELLAKAETTFQPSMYQSSQLMLADCGHAANPPGARYYIDNVRLIPAISGILPTQLTWTATDLSGIADYSYKWSQKRDEVPDTKGEGAETSKSFDKLPEGDTYFHIRAKDRAGNWGEAVHFRFVVDNRAPKVAKLSPAPGKKAAPREVKIQFDESGSGLDPASLTLTLNGRNYGLRSTTTRLEDHARTLRWDWVAACGHLKEPRPNGTEVKLHLGPAKDLVGNEAEAREWSWRLDYAKDKEGPSAPEVRCHTHALLTFDTFSTGQGQWLPYGGTGATLERVLDEERQDYCLKLANEKPGGTFAAYIRRSVFDASTYPIVSFDYKLPPGIKLQFLVHMGGWHSVRLTAEASYTEIGQVPNVKADGKWHSASFNLFEMFKQQKPELTKCPVRYLVIGEWGDGNNPRGTTYYMDNLSIMGNGSPQPELSWTSLDPTGVSDYSHDIGLDPYVEPDRKGEGSTLPVRLKFLPKPGLWYFRVRARDGAGNWGPFSVYPYYCRETIAVGAKDGLEADGWELVETESTRAEIGVEVHAAKRKKNHLLRLSWPAGEVTKLAAVREVKWKEIHDKKLSLDAFSACAGKVRLSVGLRHEGKAIVALAKPEALPPMDFARGLSFDLQPTRKLKKRAEKATKRSGAKGGVPNGSPSEGKLELLVRVAAHKLPGTLFLDNVRFE